MVLESSSADRIRSQRRTAPHAGAAFCSGSRSTAPRVEISLDKVVDMVSRQVEGFVEIPMK
jgi:hypothetical protein